MASFGLDKAVIASGSSSSKPFQTVQRLFASAAAPAEVDCCCSFMGRRSRSYRAGLVVVCGLQLQSKGDFSALSSLSSPWPSDVFCRGISRGSVVQRLGQNGASRGRGGRRENRVVTMALPIDAYWITAAEAVAVAVLMGGIAVVTGILINIRIEVEALAEYKELEEKGLLPDEIIIPDEDFDLESPLYIFQNKELSSSPSRNRPVREEFQPELETELKAELEIASKE